MIEKAIRIVWASLDTHLPATRGKIIKDVGGHAFHKKCVKEYADVIKILSELY